MEHLTTVAELASPFILAGLLVYWVYTLDQSLRKLKKEIADSNVAIANAFNSLAARLPAPAQQNASTPEAT